MDLKTRLADAARQWCLATSLAEEAPVPLSRLSKRVMDDGKFFDNLSEMPRGPSTDTLEKFARFLADPGNWPEGAVAEEARALAHVCGVTADTPSPSAGNGGELSGETLSAPSSAGREPSGSLGSAAGAATAVRPCDPADRSVAA